MGGPYHAALTVCGAIVGHIWWWSVWGSTPGSLGPLGSQATAPEWLRKFMGESSLRQQAYRSR